MSKQIIKLFALLAAVVILACIAFFGITVGDYELLPLVKAYPTNRQHDVGTARALILSVKQPDNATPDDISINMDETRYSLMLRLSSLGYSENTVTSLGDGGMLIEGTAIASADIPYLTNNCNMTIEDPDGSVIIDSTEFTGVQPQYGPLSSENTYEYYVAIRFSDEAAARLAATTGELSSSENQSASRNYINVKVDGQLISKQNVTEKYTENVIILSGNYTQRYASYLATVAYIGKLDTKMEQSASESITPMWGISADQMVTLAFYIAIAIIFIFLLLFYKISGLSGVLSLLAQISLTSIAASLFDIKLSIPVIVAFALSLILAITMNITYFEGVKSSLRSGRGISLSVRDSYEKSVKFITESAGLLLLGAVMMLIFGTPQARIFGGALAIGAISAYLCFMIFNRFILNSFASFKIKNTKLFGI